MRKHRANPTPQQQAMVDDFDADYASFDDYCALEKRIETLPLGNSKPKPKSIPHTRPGWERGEAVPLTGFNAVRDLPLGWALCPCYDSGNNHAVEDAGTMLLRHKWNTRRPKTG